MRSTYIAYSFLAVIILVAGSCRKQHPVAPDFALLHIVGSFPDGQFVVTNFKGAQPINYFMEATRIGSFEASFPGKYYIKNDVQPLGLYAFPDTLAGSKPRVNMDLKLKRGDVYTLFVGGSTSSLDTMLIKENIPVIAPADSISAVRFVNLSKGGPVSVNLKGQPNGSALQNLPYMGVSAFVNYPVKHNIKVYEFEIRDAVTGDLLLTFMEDEVYPNSLGGVHVWLGKVRTHVFLGTRGVTAGVNRTLVRRYLHN